MSIYIKGMEMPKQGTIIMILPDGTVQDMFFKTKLGEAVHVPPHGRMIDADKFERIKYEIPIKPANYSRGFDEGVKFVQKLIMDAPTIIPADKEE